MPILRVMMKVLSSATVYFRYGCVKRSCCFRRLIRRGLVQLVLLLRRARRDVASSVRSFTE